MLRKNLYSSLIGQIIVAAVNFVSIVIISRMLTPEDFGVYTVSFAIVMMFQAIQNTGASEFLIYTNVIDRSIQRATFALALLSSVILAFVLAFFAPYLASAYQSPGMEYVLYISAVSVLLTAFSIPIRAMIAREERFDTISLINFVGGISLSLSQISLAVAGYSYIGLSIGNVISALAVVILCFAIRPKYITVIPNFRGIRHIYGVTSKIFLINVLAKVYTAAPQILIGYTLGTASAAVFGRATAIQQVYAKTIAQAVNPVINARMASERRGGGLGFEHMLTASRALLAVSVAFFGMIAIYADVITPLLFGPQWDAAVPVTRIMAVGFAVWPLTSPIDGLLLAHDRSSLLLRVKVISTTLRVLLIVLLSPFGLNAIALGILVGIGVNVFQAIQAARVVSQLSIWDYTKHMLTSVVVAGSALVVTGLVALAMPSETYGIISLCVGIGLGSLTWLLAACGTRHVLWQEGVRLLQPILNRVMRRDG